VTNVARPDKAIVIAAGRGRRLMPYTDEMPKCLVPVGARSILQIALEGLRAAGAEDIVVIRGYLGEVLERRRGELGAVRFVDNPDWAKNNILESLFFAERELEGPVYLTYSDIIYTPAVCAKLAAAEGDICLVIDRAFRDIYVGRSDHPLSEGEVADLDAAGDVARVGKRALPPEDAFGEFIGLCKLSADGARWFADAWRALKQRYAGREHEPFQRAPSFRQAYLTDLLQHLIAEGRRVTAVPIDGQWREIDTVQDLERARTLLESAGKETWR
jgi:choline kinase